MPLNNGAINEILSFGSEAEIAAGDVQAQEDYAADVQRRRGHQIGLARRELANKQARQAAHMAAGLAQFIANRYPPGVLDDGDLDKIETGLLAVTEALIVKGLTGYALQSGVDSIGASLAGHIAATDVHGATSAVTGNRLILRDASGRAKVTAPVANDDIATKGYADGAGIPTTRSINTTDPLTGGGSLAENRTISIKAAGAASGSADGAAGSAVYARDTDTTSRDKAATPAGVASQISGGGFVPASRTINTTAPLTGGGNLGENRTLAISDATTSAKGAVQLATAAEVQAASNATKAITPATLKPALSKLAPLPQNASGVGQWWLRAFAKTDVTLPAGGTWAWQIFIGGSGVLWAVGVSAGGTKIHTANGNEAIGFAWRIT